MKVLETVLYAEDLSAAHEFYCGILGLDAILFNPERSLFLRCEGSVLIVFKASRTIVHDMDVPPHGATGPGHMAFAASHKEIESWRAKLASAKVEVVKEIRWDNGAQSLYFHDPAGNVLEFVTPDLWGIEQ